MIKGLALAAVLVAAPASAQVLNVTGDQRVLVLLVKYANVTGEPYRRADANEQIFGTGLGVTLQYFITAASLGRTTLVGDVTPWLTMLPKTTDIGVCNNLASAAFNAATAAGYNLAAYRYKIIGVNVNVCRSNNASFAGYAIMQGGLDLGQLSHEFGHAMGLSHSHDQSCYVEGGQQICRQQEYGEDDAMSGSNTGLYNAFQAERLGFRTPLVVTQSGDYFLEPYATATGGQPKAIKIPLANGSALYVEHRTATGVDFRMWPEGVKLHTGTLANGNSSLLLDMDRQSSMTTRVLSPGRSYEIPGIVRVETLTALASGADIRVTFLTDPAPPPVPTLSATTRVLTDLRWSNLPGSLVDIFRDAVKILTTPNDGSETVEGSGVYQVCGGDACVGAEP